MTKPPGLGFGAGHTGQYITLAEGLRQAAEALEAITQSGRYAIAKSTPDLLISDIGMPEEDGYSLISRIRAIEVERGTPLPAIALTAFAREEERTHALNAGFQMHIPKPVEPAQLVAAVATLAGRRY